MSEQEKSLAQMAHDAFHARFSGEYGDIPIEFPTEGNDPLRRSAWESAAQAVAQRVREECAARMFDLAKKAEKIGHKNHDFYSAMYAIQAMNEASHG